MHQLQQRLCAAGYLDPRTAEDSHFCARTHAAVLAFQDSYGLRTTGECDESTWSALNEASWTLGERLLFVRSPNIRGDDVVELQTLLNRIGFDCGRVDGIFGPATARALGDFQVNVGLESNGICSPDLASVIRTMASQTGEGPGIAVVREGIELAGSSGAATPRITVGTFTGAVHLAHSVTRRLQEPFPLSTTVDGEVFAQAAAANQLRSDVFVGLEIAEQEGCVVYFYSVPAFTSVGGRNLARQLAARIGSRIPELAVQTEGVRIPILRETRMPAVLCVLGPSEIVNLKVNGLTLAIAEGLAAWIEDPLAEE